MEVPNLPGYYMKVKNTIENDNKLNFPNKLKQINPT